MASKRVPRRGGPLHDQEAHPINDDEATALAEQMLKAGYAPTTAAGAFVHEEMEKLKMHEHGVTSRAQAIAIGLSKARAAGIPLPPNPHARGGGGGDDDGGARTRARRRPARGAAAIAHALGHTHVLPHPHIGDALPAAPPGEELPAHGVRARMTRPRGVKRGPVTEADMHAGPPASALGGRVAGARIAAAARHADIDAAEEAAHEAVEAEEHEAAAEAAEAPAGGKRARKAAART